MGVTMGRRAGGASPPLSGQLRTSVCSGKSPRRVGVLRSDRGSRVSFEGHFWTLLPPKLPHWARRGSRSSSGGSTPITKTRRRQFGEIEELPSRVASRAPRSRVRYVSHDARRHYPPSTFHTIGEAEGWRPTSTRAQRRLARCTRLRCPHPP